MVGAVGDEERAVGPERDAARTVERRRAAHAVGKARRARAGERAHAPVDAHRTHHVRAGVGDKGSAIGVDGDAAQVVELRGGTDAVGVAGLAAPRQRHHALEPSGDNALGSAATASLLRTRRPTQRRQTADPTVVGVAHKQMTRRAERDPHRPAERGGQTLAVRHPWAPTATRSTAARTAEAARWSARHQAEWSAAMSSLAERPARPRQALLAAHRPRAPACSCSCKRHRLKRCSAQDARGSSALAPPDSPGHG
eukprot:6172850-Pleurochrysis_carterae.AAC.1